MPNRYHGQAIVSLVFDDNDRCQITTTDPILRAHDLRGTFYNLISRIDQPGFLTLDDLRTLASNGHELGSHAFDHKRLTEMTWQEVEHQVAESKQWWAEHGLPVTTFAYPIASHCPVAESYVARAYRAGRTVDDRLNPWPFDPTRLSGFRVENTHPVSLVKGYVDWAIETKSWLILLFHQIYETAPTRFDYPIARFEEVLRYLADRSLPGPTIGEVVSGG